ncbi:hypothetical protein P3T36_005686 [Kitasatospora sp. MAP12-15]|uniref:DUF6296 family protein n=1 Tax=unclassified Kitasatospora TaxID=2633591 RepID=UPI0024730112|nr:DUF6296 family protein [Kitasatospora sp. MAP12-44]MDH6113802.1 hypothetical protein [Kitasatospora sp. MAP12-44]
MTTIERYAVTLPGTPGTHAPPRVVTVTLTERVGMDGRPVYADDAGEFLVQISADGIAEPLTTEQGAATAAKCLHAVPLPAQR